MLLLSALAILLTWAILALVLIGLGSLVLRRLDSDFLLLDAFWLGLAISVALLEVWNLFWPVNEAITIIFGCLGLLGLLENRTHVFRCIRAALSSARWLTLFYLVMVLFLAFRASGPCDYFDTGLYGAQTIRWIQTYPVVPGLANVHGRLGFNSSVLLFIAALSQGVWRGLGFHLFTGLLIAAIAFTLLPACVRLIRGSSTSPSDWFYCILTIPIASWAARARMVGTETDQPATIVCLVAAGMLFEQLCWQTPQDDRRPGYARLVVVASLFALAVTFKETTVLFALLAWCLAFRRIWTAASSFATRKLCMVGAIALSTLIVLPWLARGILLSGYPFFPSAALGFPVDWKTPLTVTKWYGEGALSWARMPDIELANTRSLAWLRPWLHLAIRDRSASQVPALIGLGSLATVAALWLRKKTSLFYPWLWLLVPALIAIIFWFIIFPGLRFGQPAIWTTAGTLGTWGTVLVVSGPRRAQITRAALAGVLVLLIWCLIGFGWKEPYRRLLVAPPLGPLPEVSATAHQTLSGLTVFVPAHGDQCWDAPLPCTPYFDETLRLRNSSSMRFGFASESRGTQLPRFQVNFHDSRPGLSSFGYTSPMAFSDIEISHVRDYWNARPCNIRHSTAPIGTREYFDQVEARKYFVEYHIPGFAQFARWRGKKVLEIGCGIGTDTINFARAGAQVTTVDLSEKSMELARQRAAVFDLEDRIRFCPGNAEQLSSFLPVEPYDLIYSFGVIHHTPHPGAVLDQLRKYSRPGTTIKIMVYHRRSYKVGWILLAEGKGQFWKLPELVAKNSEAQTGCPVTYTYTRREGRELLERHGFRITSVQVEHIFPYRIADYVQYRYIKEPYFRWMPQPLFHTLERRFGWHLLLSAEAT